MNPRAEHGWCGWMAKNFPPRGFAGLEGLERRRVGGARDTAVGAEAQASGLRLEGGHVGVLRALTHCSWPATSSHLTEAPPSPTGVQFA